MTGLGSSRDENWRPIKGSPEVSRYLQNCRDQVHPELDRPRSPWRGKGTIEPQGALASSPGWLRAKPATNHHRLADTFSHGPSPDSRTAANRNPIRSPLLRERTEEDDPN